MTEPDRAPWHFLPSLAGRRRPPVPGGRRGSGSGPQGPRAARMRRLGHGDRADAEWRDGGARAVAARRRAAPLRSAATRPTFRLVVTATGDPEVDGAVFADAEAAGVWVNSADDLRPLLLHSPRRPPRRRGDGVGVDRRAEPGTRLVAPDPPRRACGKGSATWPSCSARRVKRLRAAGDASDRWTGPRCSTARCPTSSVPATWTTPRQ